MDVRQPVFFSYARKDEQFVLRLATELREAGVSLWLDQLDIKPGDKWDQAVERALYDCDCLVIVLSEASVASPNVMDEVSFALEQGKQVVPVLMEQCQIPFRLRRLHRVDLTESYRAGVVKVADALRGEPSGGDQPTPPPPTKVRRRIAGLHWWAAGLLGLLAVVVWIGWDRSSDRDPGADNWNPKNWDPATTPAYVVVDSAWETKSKAQARVAKLNETYANSGFLWIPDFESLSGAQLFQVYVGPFRDPPDARRATCEYLAKFKKKNADHYAVLVSNVTTNQDRVFCGASP